jgi:hypothetical protein
MERSANRPAGGRIILETLVAAVGAVLINNLFSIAYTAVTGFSIPEVLNPVSISLFSAAPVIVGGFLYMAVSRVSVRVANWGIVIGTGALFILFGFSSFAPMIEVPGRSPIPAPDGFAWLSFGLHFAGPILLLWRVPAWRR